MKYTKADIKQLEKLDRIKIINSITGIKPANLIGTKDADNQTNLAIISSVFHMGSSPALIGFMMRPTGEVPRHTYDNIKKTGYYTINSIHPEFVEKAHFTSAKFDKSVSEFEACKIEEDYSDDFYAPFVEVSKIKMGMEFKQEIPIELNGTVLMIGELVHLELDDAIFDKQNDLDLSLINAMGISGLNNYYGLSKRASFPYARVEELPDFE